MSIKRLHVKYLKIEKNIEDAAPAAAKGNKAALATIATSIAALPTLAAAAPAETAAKMQEMAEATSTRFEAVIASDNKAEAMLSFMTDWFADHDFLAMLYQVQGSDKLQPPEAAARLFGLL
ncbi:MAG: hypothetical protein MRY72_02115 [Aquisalinus sp.]|nr:hypothetical protein [Aquisalinus sp.]